ncbi:MAG: glutathione peroxidase [Chitinophagaceae bacterium]
MWASKKFQKRNSILNGKATPQQSFYGLHNKLNNGEAFNFDDLRGKKVLLVNTASDCGYTHQYKDLQQLADQYTNELVVLAFPSNDFKDQEKGTDKDIANFCEKNYGIRFPLMQKSSVRKSPSQNKIFQWLTHKEQNGWNDKPPSWNFTKYLVNEKGELTHYFGPAISPLDPDVISIIKNQNHV